MIPDSAAHFDAPKLRLSDRCNRLVQLESFAQRSSAREDRGHGIRVTHRVARLLLDGMDSGDKSAGGGTVNNPTS